MSDYYDDDQDPSPTASKRTCNVRTAEPSCRRLRFAPAPAAVPAAQPAESHRSRGSCQRRLCRGHHTRKQPRPPVGVRWESRSYNPPATLPRQVLRRHRLLHSLALETTTPAQPGTSAAVSTPADDNGGLKPVGPTGPAVLPPIEKPAAAPDAINEAASGSQPPAQIAAAAGKRPSRHSTKPMSLQASTRRKRASPS